MFSSRIGLRPLAQLCRRLAVSTGAGIQDRKIWQDESTRGGAAERALAAHVSAALASGKSVGDALATVGDAVPVLFKQVVAVGDVTGQLDGAYRRLGDHYEQALTARRALLSALAWPAFQLGVAVLVVGVVIWISDAFGLKQIDGQPYDMFGFGLVGAKGLVIYATIVALAAGGIWMLVAAFYRGALWTKSLQRTALRIPIIRSAVESVALARFTWALALVTNTPMDLRKAVPLAIEATANDHYRRRSADVVSRIGRGMSLHMALAETGGFPGELIDAVAVGEQTGMLAETMERQAKEYQERATMALRALGQAVGFAVWALVAAFIIMLIFRIYGSHISQIQELSKPGAF